MKKILIAGDIHGNIKHGQFLIKQAVALKADCILQLGDFGFWPHVAWGKNFIETMSKNLQENNLDLFFIDGNHENFLALWSDVDNNNIAYEYTEEGFKKIKPNLFYIPRGTRWTWNDIKFLGIGGAFSVDKSNRQALEAKNNKPFTLWWEQEDITNADFEKAMQGDDFHVMISHDMPLQHSIPNFSNYKDQYMDCHSHYNNRMALQGIVDKFNPQFIFHGHYHHYYASIFNNNKCDIFIHGLNCDRNYNESFVLINLEELEKVKLPR